MCPHSSGEPHLRLHLRPRLSTHARPASAPSPAPRPSTAGTDPIRRHPPARRTIRRGPSTQRPWQNLCPYTQYGRVREARVSFGAKRSTNAGAHRSSGVDKGRGPLLGPSIRSGQRARTAEWVRNVRLARAMRIGGVIVLHLPCAWGWGWGFVINNVPIYRWRINSSRRPFQDSTAGHGAQWMPAIHCGGENRTRHVLHAER